MATEHTFSSDDVARMVDLAFAVASGFDGFKARIELLLRGLCEMLPAHRAIAYEIDSAASPRGDVRVMRVCWQIQVNRRAEQSQLPGVCERRRIPAASDDDQSPAIELTDTHTLSVRIRKPRELCFDFYRAESSRRFGRRELALVETMLCSPRLSRMILKNAESLASLPSRQRQVLGLLKEGLSEKEAAVRLQISRHTVHCHIKHLYQRYGVSSRSELLSRWLR